MSTILEVHHGTTYSCASPVTYGERRLMFRPNSGHDLQVIDWDPATNDSHTCGSIAPIMWESNSLWVRL